MLVVLIWLARIAAVAGVLLIAVAVVARVSGLYTLGGFSSGTILLGGMAAVLLACLGYVTALAERR